MAELDPFADEAASLAIGKLTIENRTDRVGLYGRLELTRDREGLRQARRLAAVLAAVVEALERDPDLPGQVAPPEAPETVKNPFG